MSNFRVYIQRDLRFFGGYTAFLMERYASGSVIVHTHDGRRVQQEEMTALADPDNDYFCRLPGGGEHAFLGELARVLGAVEHPEQLRADFEHLRKRHDVVVDALVDIARGKV